MIMYVNVNYVALCEMLLRLLQKNYVIVGCYIRFIVQN